MKDKKQRKAEYMKEYRKQRKKIIADIEPIYKEKLDTIVKRENTTIVEWIRKVIDEKY